MPWTNSSTPLKKEKTSTHTGQKERKKRKSKTSRASPPRELTAHSPHRSKTAIVNILVHANSLKTFHLASLKIWLKNNHANFAWAFWDCTTVISDWSSEVSCFSSLNQNRENLFYPKSILNYGTGTVLFPVVTRLTDISICGKADVIQELLSCLPLLGTCDSLLWRQLHKTSIIFHPITHQQFSVQTSEHYLLF